MRPPRPLAGMNTGRACGKKGPCHSRSTSLAWSRGGACQQILSPTPSSGVVSHGRCTPPSAARSSAFSRRRTWGCSPCSSPAMRSGRRWRAVLTCRSIECHGRARRVRLYRPQPRCRPARTLGAGQLAPRGPMQVNRCVPASEGVPYLSYLTYRGPWHHRWRAPSTRGLPTTRRSTSRT